MSRGGGNGADRRGTRLRSAAIAVAAVLVLAWWAVVIGQTEDSVFGRVPILDEVWYLDRAAEISGAASAPEAEPSFMSPLYPLLVAATGAGGGVPADRVFDGPELRGLRLFQVACWLATLVLLRNLAGRLVPPDWTGRRRAAATWLPVALYALYLPSAVYAMAVLLETPLVLLVVAAVVLLTGPRVAAGRWWALLGLGVLLGLAGLLRGTALLLVPCAVLAAVRRGPPGGSRRLAGALLVLAGAAAVLAPPVWRNSQRAGALVGPTLNAGVNLYIGNGPEANGFYVAAVPGDWRRDPAGRAFLAGRFGREEVSLAEADRLWREEAWRHMRDNPLRVLRLGLRKLWLQWQGWEIDQLTPLEGWTRTVPALRLAVVPYALLVVLGVAGFAAGLRRRDRSGLGWVLLVLLVLLVGQSLFFVVSRYRLVLAPLWCAAAGIGAVHLAGRQRGAVVAAVAAALLAVPWGLNQVRADWSGLAAANEALRWADLGRAGADDAELARAENLYRTSLAAVPSRTASWLGLASVLEARGRGAEQVAVLREGLTVARDPQPLRRALLAAALARGDAATARTTAAAILAVDPDDADTLHNLIVLEVLAGELETALTWAERYRAAHPDDPQTYLDLGVVLAGLGRRDEARAAFGAGVARFPAHAALRENLARITD